MRIAIMLVILAFIALPTAKAAPLNNSTGQPTEVQDVQKVEPIQEVVQPTITSEAPTPEPQKPVEMEQPQEAVKPQVVNKTHVAGDKQELMRQAGIPESEWDAVDYIVTKESSWRVNAWGPQTDIGKAYGLCQSLPASKMASAGSDYMTNPVTQLKWCSSYAQDRYHGWWKAYNAWRVQNWW